eukprot:426160-Prymnesium_polylepis.1
MPKSTRPSPMTDPSASHIRTTRGSAVASPYTTPRKAKSSYQVGSVAPLSNELTCSSAEAINSLTQTSLDGTPTPWLRSMCSVPTCPASKGSCCALRSHRTDTSTCPAATPPSESAAATISPSSVCSSVARSTRPSPKLSRPSPCARSKAPTTIGTAVSSPNVPLNVKSSDQRGARVRSTTLLVRRSDPTDNTTHASRKPSPSRRSPTASLTCTLSVPSSPPGGSRD